MSTKASTLTGAALIGWLVIAWLLPASLHLRASDVSILRVALILLGVIATAAFVWFYARGNQKALHPESNRPGELALVFAQAGERLKSARFDGTRIYQFPVVTLLGDAGSAKTTAITRSGLDPELLAGEASDENSIGAPTSLLNIWLARNTIFLDPAGGVLANRVAFLKMSAHLAPPVSASLTNRQVQPRAAVVCISCEDFLQPRAAESLAMKARQIREQLADLGASAGSSLPLYVLFTKADRLTHFSEYVANLTNAEAQEVLGATLPLHSDRSPGESPQSESQRISDALFWLFSSLSDKRLLYLAREHDPVKSSAIYEFPRELRKLKPLLVQFLADLSRPRQLQVNPVLRGFYFTGVRPINVSDVAPAPAAVSRRARTEYADATQIFVQPRTQEPAPSPSFGSRRVPQWVYSSRIFPDIVLADRVALESSKDNVKTGRVQRAALVAACVAGLALAGMWTVSFLGNYRLASAAQQAIQAANGAQPGPGLASAQAIRNLAPARLLVESLDGYRANGIPLYLRWGLFSGNGLYQPLFRSWYGGFQRLLLVPAQSGLVGALSHTGASNNRDYRAIYDALKAYLITTANPDKNPPEKPGDFLSPVLVQYWLDRQTATPDQLSAASAEFHFYSRQLRNSYGWPYASAPNANAVSTARSFLNRLSSSEPLYQQIIAHPNQGPALIFNRLYPGSDRFVINSYAVPAAFTKAGWTATQANVRNVSDYFKGEEWVLGPSAFANVDKTRLQNDLQSRYKADFAKHWREYLRRTSVVHFSNIQDAANKLSTLGGNQSPLLEALCLVSDNTSVDPSIQSLFQPPQQIVPLGCTDHLSSPANDNYMQSLISLQASLTALTTEPTNDSLRANALAKATDADVAVQQAARKFTIDKEGVIDSQTKYVLEAPVKYVETLLAGAGKEDANGAARGFCSQFNLMMRKYPFAPFSAQIASPSEVSSIFAPNQGALWKLYQEHLQKYLLLTGATFSPRPGAASTLNPTFTSFLNRAAGVSDALYHSGPEMHLSFDLRVIPDENVQSVFLTIHGQTLNYSANSPATQHFTWPGGGPDEIKMRVKFAGGTELEYPAHSGPWDLFRFFGEAEQWQVRGNEYTMDKPLRSGGGTITVPATGRPATVRFALGMSGAASLLKPGTFSGLGCVPVAIR